MLFRSAAAVFFLFSLAVPAQSEDSAYALMPLPAHLTGGTGSLVVHSDFRLNLEGYQEPRLHRAARRFLSRLERQTGFQFPIDDNPYHYPAAFTVSCDHAGKPVQEFGEDESYRLEITPNGARLTAPQPLGILRGLETAVQLLRPGIKGFEFPAVSIQDEPRFPWRGLTYDVARHFMPADQVRRTLDGMAAVKLNVLHWHLSDNQGFRIESKIFPRLQTMASDGLYYTQAQIREIVSYARDLGIRIIPEIDVPGHATGILVAYPNLAAGPPPRELDRLFGVMDPVLDPSKPAVYVFLNRLFGELASLFPDAYFHIGGDEVNGRLWRESLGIQAFKEAQGYLPSVKDPDGNAAFHAMFNRRLQTILAAYGKKVDGWDEILSPDLSRSIVIQSWRGPKSLSEAVHLGYQAILSSGWYLDLCFPASKHYLVDPLDNEAASLSPDEQKRILGGEAAMWSEWVTPETMDSRLWPRAAVVAERLWSPRDVRDVPDMYRRLDAVSVQLEWLGLTHRSWQRPMLLRLAGPANVEALQTFAEMVEPVQGYDRENYGPYTTTTPLIRLIDAVPPESHAARLFSLAVTAALKPRKKQDSTRWAATRQIVVRWRENALQIAPFPSDSALLGETGHLAGNAAELASLALDAISALEANGAIDPAWKTRALTRVAALQAPIDGLSLAFLQPVKEILSFSKK